MQQRHFPLIFLRSSLFLTWAFWFSCSWISKYRIWKLGIMINKFWKFTCLIIEKNWKDMRLNFVFKKMYWDCNITWTIGFGILNRSDTKFSNLFHIVHKLWVKLNTYHSILSILIDFILFFYTFFLYFFSYINIFWHLSYSCVAE